MNAGQPHHPPTEALDGREALEETRRQLALLHRRIEIEEALDRIRDRAMAMHRSDELAEVIAVVYEQFQGLGFDAWGCALITRDDAGDGWNMWLSVTEQTVDIVTQGHGTIFTIALPES